MPATVRHSNSIYSQTSIVFSLKLIDRSVSFMSGIPTVSILKLQIVFFLKLIDRSVSFMSGITTVSILKLQ